jgi:hypothetical protein
MVRDGAPGLFRTFLPGEQKPNRQVPALFAHAGDASLSLRSLARGRLYLGRLQDMARDVHR